MADDTADDDPACCAASRSGDRPSSDASAGDTPSSDRPSRDGDGAQTGTDRFERTEPADEPPTAMVRIDGGEFRMGTDDDVGFPEDGEGPARDVTVDPFFVDRYAVTNVQFLEFVRETGYVTDAQRYGWSFVFESFLAEEDEDRVLDDVSGAPWWVAVEGASWFRPTGPASSVVDDDLLDHPVTHVSWNDAVAYAEWAGKRLPTEAEWECAARGGLEGKRYPWGDELRPGGEHRCNIWQGEFPARNTGEDGHLGTAPVDAFEPNGYGLYNPSGNVWEWCGDWFSPTHHRTDASTPENPTGPDRSGEPGAERVMRGGSYLCHRSWCNRYRVAARSKNTPDSSTGNLGFRCVVDATDA